MRNVLQYNITQSIREHIPYSVTNLLFLSLIPYAFFTFPENDGGIRILQTPDKGFIIGGWIGSEQNAGLRRASLIKTNAEGDTLWTKAFIPPPNYGDFRSLIIANNQDYIATGSWNSGPGQTQTFIVRTDQLGNTIWSKMFDFEPALFGHDVMEQTNGDIILAGTYLNDAPRRNVYSYRSGCSSSLEILYQR